MDIVQDRNRAHLAHLVKIAGGIAHVKSAEECLPGAESQLRSLPASSFLDNDRRWPCHTKEATMVSAAYLADLGEKAPPEALQNLSKFASMWGITDDVRRVALLVGMHNQLKTAASEAEAFALDVDHNGERVQRFPIDTPELVKLSCDRFYIDRAKYPYAWRQKVAETLLDRARMTKVAQLLDEPVTAYLEKAAGEGLGTTSALWRELAQRQHLAKHQAGLPKLAEAVEGLTELSDNGFMEPDHVKLACQAFQAFDSNARIYDMVRLPEEALVDDNHTMTKVAAERANWVKLANGRQLDLRKLDLQKLAAVAPGLAGKDLTELRDILPTLPADTAEVLSQVA